MNAVCPYVPFGNFILRLSAFPVSMAESLFAQNRVDRKQLIKILQDPIVQEAIFLASPDFFREMVKWMESDTGLPKKDQQMLTACIRFISRMAFRSTPFGLFAGITTGKWGESMTIGFTINTCARSHTRLDMSLLFRLGQSLKVCTSLRRSIRFFPNSSIYTVGNSLRYIEKMPNGRNRLVSVRRSQVLEELLHQAEDGITYPEVISHLKSRGYTASESEGYVEQLAEHQLLVDELFPSVTGPDYFLKMIRILKESSAGSQETEPLEKILSLINRIDAEPIGRPVSAYQPVVDTLKTIPFEMNPQRIFRTDHWISTSPCELPAGISEKVMQGVEILNRLTIRQLPPQLVRFRKRFLQRYGAGEIPLLLALDSDTGVGYDTVEMTADVAPFLEDFTWQIPDGNPHEWPRSEPENYLLNKYLRYLEDSPSPARELVIDERDPPLPEVVWSDVPQTLSVVFKMLQKNKRESARGEIHLIDMGGLSAANLLSRFCHLHADIQDIVSQIIQAEQDAFEDPILAEIVHLPGERAGNILSRPVLRSLEIPYLAISGAQNGSVIPPSDLIASIRNNQIILRSGKLKKQIIPRLTTAHNYSAAGNLPVYRFLCDLQFQGNQVIQSFSWGRLMPFYRFFPRVRFQTLILSPAMWKILVADLKRLAVVPDSKYAEALEIWKRQIRLPDWVCLKEHDREWILPLHNQDCLQALYSKVKNRQEIWLFESLLHNDSSAVRSNGDGYAHEFIAMYYKSTA